MTDTASPSADTRPSSAIPTEVFVSYAQNGEDVLLWRALRGVKAGCYIDVGAAEPMIESVTHAFYLRGWRGINLEPVPGTFARLSAARPDEINLNLAAGDREGTASFFLVDGGNGLSTAVADQAESLQAQGWKSVEIEVPVRTLASIVDEHVRGPVHFLKVDAEGSERAVLAGAELRRFRPWIILVEATAPNSQDPTHQFWEDILLEADYRFVWFDGLNRFYVATERAELAEAFQAQPNVFDGFIRHSEAEACEQLAQARVQEEATAAALRATRDELEALRADLAQATAREQETAASLRAAGDELETRQARLRELEAMLGRMSAEAAAQASRTDALTAEIARMATEAGALTAEIARMATEAGALTAEIARIAAERDSWAQELFETNRHAAHLAQVRQILLDEGHALRYEVTRAQGETVRAQGETARVQQEVARLQQHVQAFYASTSWRVSWPVRAAARLLGRR